MADVHGPAPWMVRIVDGGGGVHGAGVLVAADRVLTCAHVLESIHGEPFAQFVDPPGAEPVAVTPDFVAPSGADQRGDIAVLALPPRPERVTATLRRFPVRRARRFRAYAFPDPDEPEIGYWAVTTLVGQGGPGGEWMQLESETGFPVSKGFSGAGVLADPLGHLVGMIVAAQPSARLAFMIPADTIARYLPRAPWIAGTPAVADDFARHPATPAPDETVLREVSAFVDGPPGVNVHVVAGSAGSAAARAAAVTGGGVDLAVDCAGLPTAEIVRRIAERAGVADRHIAGDEAPPMTIVLSGVDRAADPAGVLRSVVHPLSERDANRILLSFEEEHSAALPMARSIEKERSSRSAEPSEAGAALARARLAERIAEKLQRRAGAVISGLPPLDRRAHRLHAEYRALTGAGPRAAALRSAALDAEAAALTAADRLDGLLGEHRDQRGLLSSYQRLSAQYGHAEDPALTTLYRRAYALLHDGPADRAEAAAAVEEFAAAVRAVRR